MPDARGQRQGEPGGGGGLESMGLESVGLISNRCAPLTRMSRLELKAHLP